MYNLKFDRKQDELVYKKMSEYQTIKAQGDHPQAAHILSMVHLRRGIFMSSGSDRKLNIWVPGRSQPNNYLGQLEEDCPVSNLQVFGQHLKKQKDEELQVIYTCG
jgi:hypothetical protein